MDYNLRSKPSNFVDGFCTKSILVTNDAKGGVFCISFVTLYTLSHVSFPIKHTQTKILVIYHLAGNKIHIQRCTKDFIAIFKSHIMYS